MARSIESYQIVQSGSGLELARNTQTLRDPAPTEVVVKIEAASLNYRDLLVLHGAGGTPRDGLVPLSDGAGTVVAVGREVTRWNVGDRVATSFFPHWHGGPFQKHYLAASLGGGQTDGVLSEAILADEQSLVAVPEHLTLQEAATLPCAAVTAWHALFERCNVQPNDTVLLQGTGGVALFALQLAVAKDARVIVLSSSDAKLENVSAMGAWKTINYQQNPAWHEEVLKLTEGLGVDHLLELAGAKTYDQSIAAIAAGGQIAQIGGLSGFDLKPNLLPLQFMNADIHGICVGSSEHFGRLASYLERHGIKPVIDQVFGFEEVPAAYERLQSGQQFGKLVIEL